MAENHATSYERDLGRERIRQLRAEHPFLRPADDVPPEPVGKLAHDPLTCIYCLGTDCFWCDRAGQTLEFCDHSLSARHGAPLPPRPEPEVAPEPEYDAEAGQEAFDEEAP